MKYVVKTLSMSGKGNKIHRNGDIVTAENFPDDNINTLVKQGFIVPLEGNNEPVQRKVDSLVEKINEHNHAAGQVYAPESPSEPENKPEEYNNIRVVDLRKILNNSDPKLDKKALYKLYLKTFE